MLVRTVSEKVGFVAHIVSLFVMKHTDTQFLFRPFHGLMEVTISLFVKEK
jgi:hypothetical protein